MPRCYFLVSQDLSPRLLQVRSGLPVRPWCLAAVLPSRFGHTPTNGGSRQHLTALGEAALIVQCW